MYQELVNSGFKKMSCRMQVLLTDDDGRGYAVCGDKVFAGVKKGNSFLLIHPLDYGDSTSRRVLQLFHESHFASH